MDGALRISTRESRTRYGVRAPAHARSLEPLQQVRLIAAVLRAVTARWQWDTAMQARLDALGDRLDGVGVPEEARSHGHAQADGRDGGSCPSRVRLMWPLLMHRSLRDLPPVSRHTAPACAAVLWHNRRGMGGHAPQILGSRRGLAGTAWPGLWRVRCISASSSTGR